MFDIQSTGQYISFMRKNKGMTQGQLAEKLGVSHQAVSNWERGETMPDIAILTQLAKVLGTTVDRLLLVGEVASEDKYETNNSSDNKEEKKKRRITMILMKMNLKKTLTGQL